MKLEVQFQIKERDDPTKKNILILPHNFVCAKLTVGFICLPCCPLNYILDCNLKTVL